MCVCAAAAGWEQDKKRAFIPRCSVSHMFLSRIICSTQRAKFWAVCRHIWLWRTNTQTEESNRVINWEEAFADEKAALSYSSRSICIARWHHRSLHSAGIPEKLSRQTEFDLRPVWIMLAAEPAAERWNCRKKLVARSTFIYLFEVRLQCTCTETMRWNIAALAGTGPATAPAGAILDVDTLFCSHHRFSNQRTRETRPFAFLLGGAPSTSTHETSNAQSQLELFIAAGFSPMVINNQRESWREREKWFFHIKRQ